MPTAEQQRGPQAVAPVAVDRDRDVDVGEEGGQRGGVVGPDLDGGHVPSQRGRLTHRVEGGAGLRGGRCRDHVGALLEVPAVEGHEAEGRTELEVFLDSVVREQVREAPHYSWRRVRRPKVAVSTAARPRARSSPSHFGPKSLTHSLIADGPVGDQVDGRGAVADLARSHAALVPAVVRQVGAGDHEQHPGRARHEGQALGATASGAPVGPSRG